MSSSEYLIDASTRHQIMLQRLIGNVSICSYWNDIFSYKDGKIYWKFPIGRKIKIGSEAGSASTKGYYRVKINGKSYRRHRIVYEMHFGVIPIGMVVDHINDRAGDDRIENLQILTERQNSAKQRVSKNIRRTNKSGVTGVHWDEKRGAWRAKIRIGRKTMHIGYYSSLSVAAKARLEYEDNFHYANE